MVNEKRACQNALFLFFLDVSKKLIITHLLFCFLIKVVMMSLIYTCFSMISFNCAMVTTPL